MARLPVRVIGTENEYAAHSNLHRIGLADDIVAAYQGSSKTHANFEPTHESIVSLLSAEHESREGDYKNSSQEKNGFYGGKGSIIKNGGRFYVDMGHPEYCTPETTNARDALIWNRAGEVIVHESAKLAAEINGADISIIKNNSDGDGHSYAAHENYGMRRLSENDFKKIVVTGLLPFFVTRQIFTGAGKVGIESPTTGGDHYYLGDSDGDYSSRNFERTRRTIEDALDTLAPSFVDIPEFLEVTERMKELLAKRKLEGASEIYQLSQRADFFNTIMSIHTTSNRPLINTRDDPLANKDKYFRLHVILGDANRCDVASYLKLGTTSIVLDLIEDGIAPNIKLFDPVRSNKIISRDQSRQWLVELSDGKTISAIDIQREYLSAALRAYGGRDKITDDVIKRWRDTLDALETNPMLLFGKVDWITKQYILTKIAGDDMMLPSNNRVAKADLSYHNVDPNASLFSKLLKSGKIEKLVSDEEIIRAVNNAPLDTRAYLRAKAVARNDVSSVDWGGFVMGTGNFQKKVYLHEPLAGNQGDLVGLYDPGNQIGAKILVERLESIKGIEVVKYKDTINKLNSLN